MSALSHVLDRLRSVSPPPGAAATVVAVPSAGEELSREVEFRFGELDELHGRHQALLEAARAEAAALHDAAIAERARLLAQARTDAEQLAAQLLSERRTRARSPAAARSRRHRPRSPAAPAASGSRPGSTCRPPSAGVAETLL
jgi:hypothetical protein